MQNRIELKIVQHLRYKSSLSVIGKKDKIMKDESQNHIFNNYIERFFNILSTVREYEIINSTDVLNKCVLIEDSNIFYSCLCLNLSHHSKKLQIHSKNIKSHLERSISLIF